MLGFCDPGVSARSLKAKEKKSECEDGYQDRPRLANELVPLGGTIVK